MVSWLVPSTPDRAALVRVWPGTFCCVLWQSTLHSASLHEGVELGTGKLNAGGNPVID